MNEPDSNTTEAGIFYFLVCFQSREYVANLLSCLYQGDDLYLVHCDSKAPQDLKDYIYGLTKRFGNIVQVETRDYSWAGYSHVDITLRAMADALQRSPSWSHAVLLSEQHLPLKSPLDIRRTLCTRSTMIDLQVASTMLPEAQADIQNRFAARYRELPGVGAFAVDLTPRAPDFFDHIYHGSNWIAVRRDHCVFLVEEERRGAFDLFKSIVHAEEMAIPSVLASRIGEIDRQDVTLVAAPHLVDNHGLVMTEGLFHWGVASPFLFIRKRTPVLPPSVDAAIRGNHFVEDVYECAPSSSISSRLTASLRRRSDLTRLDALKKEMSARLGPDVHIEWRRPESYAFASRIHCVVTSNKLRQGLSVRLFSQNFIDFKAAIVEAKSVDGTFSAPVREAGALHSTIRVKLTDLFGYREILPDSIANYGFISVRDGASVAGVASLVALLYEQAAELSKQSNLKGHMSRAQRINELARLIGARRYLEVGVCEGETFFEVDVPTKVAVDPNFRFDYRARANASTHFHPVPSDDFFAHADATPFDLIYLDGLHTFDQTTRDFFNSLRLSHERTVWLLDDTVPNNALSALPNQAECYQKRAAIGDPDPSWMGDVFKTVFLIDRTLPFFHYRTFDGHGQTVVWQSKVPRPLAADGLELCDVASMTFEQMQVHQSVLNVSSADEIFSALSVFAQA